MLRIAEAASNEGPVSSLGRACRPVGRQRAIVMIRSCAWQAGTRRLRRSRPDTRHVWSPKKSCERPQTRQQTRQQTRHPGRTVTAMTIIFDVWFRRCRGSRLIVPLAALGGAAPTSASFDLADVSTGAAGSLLLGVVKRRHCDRDGGTAGPRMRRCSGRSAAPPTGSTWSPTHSQPLASRSARSGRPHGEREPPPSRSQ